MNELEDGLKQADADGARFKLIATDGVFSMDGYVAKLPEICALAERYGAMVLVDDCHATGHLGDKGRGTPALTGAGDRVDIVTGTFGKTLGGGMGGFVAAAQPIVDLLRQRARPYLFSNSPRAAGRRRRAEGAGDRHSLPTTAARCCKRHAQRFRAGRRGRPASRPCRARRRSFRSCSARRGSRRIWRAALDARGVYVAGFFFPVVPKGQARIRTQMSAALTARTSTSPSRRSRTPARRWGSFEAAGAIDESSGESQARARPLAGGPARARRSGRTTCW